MTDPQNDKPCRDCKRPTQHATERCDDCRSPAGRLVTALAALGVKATIDDDHIVTDEEIRGYVAPGGWEIACDEVGDEVDAIEAAANAIAAIVQAPGLRAESAEYDAFTFAIAGALDIPADSEKYDTSDPRDLVRAVRDVRERCEELDDELNNVFHALTADGYDGETTALPDRVHALRSERDTLAAEVKRLTERLEVFAGALLSLGAS